MEFETWVRGNRNRIDTFVHKHYDCDMADDDERERWVLNVETLYQEAISDGVDI